MNTNNIQDYITSEDDVLSLEDDVSKIVLQGKISSKEVVNGCIVAVKGVVRSDPLSPIVDEFSWLLRGQ